MGSWRGTRIDATMGFVDRYRTSYGSRRLKRYFKQRPRLAAPWLSVELESQSEKSLLTAYSDLREAISIEKRYFTSDLINLS
jgi:hypothetical protein